MLATFSLLPPTASPPQSKLPVLTSSNGKVNTGQHVIMDSHQPFPVTLFSLQVLGMSQGLAHSREASTSSGLHPQPSATVTLIKTAEGRPEHHTGSFPFHISHDLFFKAGRSMCVLILSPSLTENKTASESRRKKGRTTYGRHRAGVSKNSSSLVHSAAAAVAS